LRKRLVSHNPCAYKVKKRRFQAFAFKTPTCAAYAVECLAAVRQPLDKGPGPATGGAVHIELS
jgi:hypothetical protein